MSKTCVFIIGTNAVGKSSLARELIARYGGILSTDSKLTICKDSRVCLAGQYNLDKRYGGVDCIKNDKGSSCSSRLKEIAEEGLKTSDVIICEGMILHTFGLNLLNAAFVAKKQLVVFLYAPVIEIHRRLLNRSQTGIKTENVWKKQKATAVSARKWASIGVPVLSYDTSKTAIKDIASQVINKLEEMICGK